MVNRVQYTDEHCQGPVDPLCQCYMAGYSEGLDRGHDAGYLQAHTELVAIATGEGKEYTATERKGIGKATQAAWAALQNRWADV